LQTVVQHEWEKRACSRFENRVLMAQATSHFGSRTLSGVESYKQEAKNANGSAGTGHPEGKQPDAFFRNVVFRLWEHLGPHRNAIIEAVGNSGADETVKTKVQEALAILESHAGKATTRGNLFAKRCLSSRQK